MLYHCHHTSGGRSLLYSCIHVRSGPIYWGLFTLQKILNSIVFFKIKVNSFILIHPIIFYFGELFRSTLFHLYYKENWKEDCNLNNTLKFSLPTLRYRTLTPHWIHWFNNVQANWLEKLFIQFFSAKITSFHPLPQTLPLTRYPIFSLFPCYLHVLTR